MATVILKNVTSGKLYLRDLSDSLEPSESVTITRTLAELTAATGLSASIAAGELQLVSLQVSAAEQVWTTGSGNGTATTGPMTLYVATTGDDLNNGLTASTPLRTIGAALKKVPFLILPGHPVTINVAAGTYDEKIISPAFMLGDAITIAGAAMTPTAPPLGGLDSGTFDASFGTQAFPQRVLMTGAGWTAGNLAGGYFVEVMDGAAAGALLPIVNNGTNTLDLPVVVNTGTYNLQGRQFRIVKPSTILTRSTTDECFIAASLAAGSSNTTSSTAATSGQGYLTLNRLELRRVNGASFFVRVNNGSFVRLNQCSMLDLSTGGSSLVTYATRSTLRMDDCLLYRATSNNTILCSGSIQSNFIGNRLGGYGGNYTLSGSSCNVSLQQGFIRGADEAGVNASTGTQLQLNNVGIDACRLGVNGAHGSLLLVTNATIKNCTVAGVSEGFNTSAFATSVGGATSMHFSSVTIDACPRGVVVGPNCALTMTGTCAITNCTSFGIDMAVNMKAGGSMVQSVSTLSMSGNGADFTLDGTTGVSLATLRAASPKRVVEATAWFNRLIEL